MADFSFGFTGGSFLLLNGQKHSRLVAKDLISKGRTIIFYRGGLPFLELADNFVSKG